MDPTDNCGKNCHGWALIYLLQILVEVQLRSSVLHCVVLKCCLQEWRNSLAGTTLAKREVVKSTACLNTRPALKD